MASPVVAVRSLQVVLGTNVVLRGIDLTVTRGEVLAVTGVNGVGKSTLLRCLAGLLRPTAGELTVMGAAPRDDAAFWRAVGLLADEPAWYPGLTVREHLELVRLTHEPVRVPWLSAEELLEAFGLTEQADAVPLILSSGQRQRLALAAVLARPSSLLLLDEPEQSLDTEIRQRLAALLTGYVAAGGTVVLATHDLALVKAADARQLVLSDGRAVAANTAGPQQ